MDLPTCINARRTDATISTSMDNVQPPTHEDCFEYAVAKEMSENFDSNSNTGNYILLDSNLQKKESRQTIQVELPDIQKACEISGESDYSILKDIAPIHVIADEEMIEVQKKISITDNSVDILSLKKTEMEATCTADDSIPSTSVPANYIPTGNMISDGANTTRVNICKKTIRNSQGKTVVTRSINYPKRSTPLKRKLAKGRSSSKKAKLHLSEAEADEILEGMSDIDDLLEGSALKNNLTTLNVKNILKSVITNPDVLNYVWNKMHQNVEGKTSLAALYEPKLTRSTVRKLCEGSDSVQTDLAELEGEDEAVKLLGKELPENESSDEEYDPEKDPEESEDEDNSIIVSDIGSPSFSNTSCLTPAILEEDDSKEASTTLDEFPKLVIAEESIDIIAQRTRSRLPLDDTPLECLEAAFIAPDITTDMYDSDCGDEDWKQFLNDIYKHRPDPVVEVEDDNDDPEYNFLEEEDITDEWDFRSDRAVKISKKELSDLVAELIEATEGCDGEVIDCEIQDDGDETDDSVIREKPQTYVDVPATSTICELVASSPPALISEECRALLDQHMRMHIQLLSQVFLLSSHDPGLVAYQNGSKSLVCELKCLSRKTFPDGSMSAFQAYNLDEAVKLVSLEKPSEEIIKIPIKKPHSIKYDRGLFRSIPKEIQEIIANSTVFIYPHLLPIRLLYHPVFSNKVYFSPSEDELIALGLEQFTPLRNQFPTSRLLQSLLLNCKSEQQIRVRIKNIKKRSKTDESNPIKYFLKHGKVRPNQNIILPFDSQLVVPPIKRPKEIIPDWLENLKRKVKGYKYISPNIVSISKTDAEDSSTCTTPTNRYKVAKPRSTWRQDFTTKFSMPKRRYNFILPRPSPNSIYSSFKNISPMKQLSPILKKYHSFRGPLNFSPKKLIECGRRPIAPKTLPVEFGRVVKNLAPIFPSIPIISIPSPPAQPTTLDINSPSKYDEADLSSVTQEIGNPVTSMDKNSSVRLIFEAGDQPVNCSATLGSPEPTVHNDPSNDGGSQSEMDTCEEEEEMQDNEGDLAALMTASSTIFKNPLQLPKRTRQQRELESTLALLGPDLPNDEPIRENRDVAFAHTFIRRVKDVLANDLDIFGAFLRVLLHFRSQSKFNPVFLFQEVCETLHSYPTLIREFVSFLLPEQAMECNRFSERFLFEKVLVFWRKMEVHFNRQPRQLKKLRRALMQLEKRGDISSDSLCSAVQPFLRNHAHLLEEFHGLLPEKKPAEIYRNDFEDFSLPDSDSEMTDFEDHFEEFVLPDKQDLYGTAKCPCVCHQNATDLRMKNRKRHCTKCGIRFIDGRVFLHVGKVLKPARVTCHYKTAPETPTRRFISPSNTTYPVGTNQCLRNLVFRSPSKETGSRSPSHSIGGIFDTDTDTYSPSKLPPGKDLKAILESGISDLLTFPSQFAQFSESGEDQTDLSPITNETTNVGGVADSMETWSKEEDKLLLETCQRLGANECAFKIVQSTLTHKSIKCIQDRFWKLLRIFSANQKSDDEDHSEED